MEAKIKRILEDGKPSQKKFAASVKRQMDEFHRPPTDQQQIILDRIYRHIVRVSIECGSGWDY